MIRPMVMCVLLCVQVRSAVGARGDFLTTYGGRQVPGSQICFFRGHASNQLVNFFGADEQRCLDADRIIDIPPGSWNFFARKGAEYVSAWPDHIEMTIPVSVGTYKQIEVPLQVAGTLDTGRMRLRADEHLVAYFPSEPTKPGFVIPQPTGTSRFTVPANRSFVPIVVRNGVPSAVGTIEKVGVHAVLELSEISASSFDILAWFSFERDAPFSANRITSPEVAVSLEGPGPSIAALTTVRLYSPADLLIFKNVRPAIYRVKARHRFWRIDPVSIVPSAGLSVVKEPLWATLTGALTVSWTRSATVPVFQPDCNGSRQTKIPADAQPPRLDVLQCAGYQPTMPADTVDFATCHVVASAKLSGERSGDETFESVEPGAYTVRMRQAGVPDAIDSVVVEQLSVLDVAKHCGFLLAAPEKRGRPRRRYLLPVRLDELVHLPPMNHCLPPTWAAYCTCSRKKRSISFVASGPFGSVNDPAGLPPDHA